MAFITDKTQVNELSQIQIPKCYENYVNKAIASSTYLLTMKEFIDITGFEVNAETFDILFMNINDEGIPIYIDDNMLNWMGYESINKKEKLRDCKNLLKNNFKVNDDYKILKNKEYTIFLKDESEKIKGDIRIALINKTFPKPSTGTSARSKTHLIIMPESFKSLCMMISTYKGKQIKKYYLTLEKLIQSYFIYQCVFNNLYYKKELDSLKNLPHIKKYTETQNRIRLNEEIRNVGKLGYVYFIQEELTKNIKIGYTYNLNSRLTELQIGNSQKLEIILFYESNKPNKLEQELHKKYHKYHIRGEWFKNKIIEMDDTERKNPKFV